LTRKRKKRVAPAPDATIGVTRCERCGNIHHSAVSRVSRSPVLGLGVFVLCERCFQQAERESVYRCDRCGNQEASVASRRRATAAGGTMEVPLCDHCDWATQWRTQPERLPGSSRMLDWATLAAGIALVLLPVLSIPRLQALVRTYHASNDAQAVSVRLYATRMHAEQSFTRARVLVDSHAGLLVAEKFDRRDRDWHADGEPLHLSSSTRFGFGKASTPPPEFSSLRQSDSVMFNSRGVPVNDAAEVVPDNAIYLTNGQWSFAITVTPAGHISIWRYEDGVWKQS
jgi:hypothetical protein